MQNDVQNAKVLQQVKLRLRAVEDRRDAIIDAILRHEDEQPFHDDHVTLDELEPLFVEADALQSEMQTHVQTLRNLAWQSQVPGERRARERAGVPADQSTQTGLGGIVRLLSRLIPPGGQHAGA